MSTKTNQKILIFPKFSTESDEIEVLSFTRNFTQNLASCSAELWMSTELCSIRLIWYHGVLQCWKTMKRVKELADLHFKPKLTSSTAASVNVIRDIHSSSSDWTNFNFMHTRMTNIYSIDSTITWLSTTLSLKAKKKWRNQTKRAKWKRFSKSAVN